MMTRSLGIGRLLLFGLVSAATLVAAHAHHDAEDVGPYEHNFTNEEPLDHVIKWHIAIQISCWGILFPIGMVLGITRSRFHVPWQLVAIALSLGGNYLGHHHHGRGFHMTAHAHFATYLWWYLVLQLAFGVFLKLHVLEGTTLRRGVVVAHGIVGKSFPVVGWVQMIFGGIAALGFCFGDHFGQCLAHFIMGSAFIGYAMILLLMLRVGAGFLARKRVSQEYLDSWVIMLWGIVNTFTEHNFLAPHPTGWSHKDMQHVSLGVLWWAGGALGIFLGRKSTRNVVPAVIIGMTGYAMANHGQHLEFSTDVHKLFGWSLMSAGFARIIEVCFVLRDSASDNVRPPRAFQHLPPYLLVLSGLTFLSATEEQMQWIAGSGMDSTTYANILFSGAFAIYLVGNALLELYMVLQAAHKQSPSTMATQQHAEIGLAASEEEEDDDDQTGHGDEDEDVENATGAGGPRRYRPPTTGTSSSPLIKRLAHAVPAALAGLAGSVASVVRSLDNAASSSSSSSGARAGAGAGAGNREMAEYYESLPLTNRDSADHHRMVQEHDHDGHTLSSSSAAARGAAQQYLQMNGDETTSSHAAGAGGRIADGRRADQQAGAGRASVIDETVFDIGDFGEDDDDGGDGYWHDDDDDKEGVEGAAQRAADLQVDHSNGTSRDDEEARARSSRHAATVSTSAAQGVHRTARVVA